LLIRYRRSEDGKPVAKAVVYTQAEHRIERSRIDQDALRIIERLRENGHEAYIVGGAVRDLLLGRKPKDFDIVTDAQPPRIKRVFRNARIIGRRFRLVHVYAGPKIFEVSTFRSIANGTIGNEFGTIDEDALRRDFTMNALYYDPLEAVLVDYVGGFKDMAAKRVKPVIPLKTIFKEDPVRMIRCVKYAATSEFRIPLLTRFAIRRDASLLAAASASRLTEEFVKILGSGRAGIIFKGLSDFDLLRHILPNASARLDSDPAFRKAFFLELDALDTYASEVNKEKRLSILLSHYLKPFVESFAASEGNTPEAYQEALHQTRTFFAPLNPPRVELEAALLIVFKKLGVSPLQRPRRPGPERGWGNRGAEPRARMPDGRAREEPRRKEEGDYIKDLDTRDLPPEAEDRDGEGLGPKGPKRKRRRRKPASERGIDGIASPLGMATLDDGAAVAKDDAGARIASDGSGSETASAKRRRRRRKKSSDSSGAIKGES